MTEREQLHQLVEEIPAERAGDALDPLRLITKIPKSTGRPGFAGIAATEEADLGRRAKNVLRAEFGDSTAALEETGDVLSSIEAMRQLAESRAAVEAGDVLDADQLAALVRRVPFPLGGPSLTRTPSNQSGPASPRPAQVGEQLRQ